MIIYKISLEFEGDKLIPKDLVHLISDELELVSSFSFDDIHTIRGKDKQYGFGGMYYMLPKKVCFDTDDIELYERIIINFLKTNYTVFNNNGVSDINIQYEVYFTGDNFSIGLFDKDHLKLITACNATLSFSGYQMSEAEMLTIFRE